MNEGNTETVRKLMSLEDDAPIDKDIDVAITKVQDMAARAGRYLLSGDVMTLIVQDVLSKRGQLQKQAATTNSSAGPKRRGGRPKGSKNKKFKPMARAEALVAKELNPISTADVSPDTVTGP